MSFHENKHAIRISVSLPPTIASRFDDMIKRHGLSNRSRAITDIIERRLVDERDYYSESVLMGSVTLFYDSNNSFLPGKINSILRKNIEAVVGDNTAHSGDGQVMEVVLLRGRVELLWQIADEIAAAKGVHSSGLVVDTQSATSTTNGHQ